MGARHQFKQLLINGIAQSAAAQLLHCGCFSQLLTASSIRMLSQSGCIMVTLLTSSSRISLSWRCMVCVQVCYPDVVQLFCRCMCTSSLNPTVDCNALYKLDVLHALQTAPFW